LHLLFKTLITGFNWSTGSSIHDDVGVSNSATTTTIPRVAPAAAAGSSGSVYLNGFDNQGFEVIHV